MTVELAVLKNNKATFTIKYPFTKIRFRLTFSSLADKMCITNFKENKLPFCDVCFFATKRVQA